ncbi:tetraacyldisaccharide 4'-kinase, partial [bacterium]|nr:tetraacyldisaccharide 4'-kinase [bacterium]
VDRLKTEGGKLFEMPSAFSLQPSALVYGFCLFLREFLYRAGVFTSKRLSAKVISIGNITLGGTGKTPAVMALAKKLQGEGRKVAVLLRGYKGRLENKGGVVSDGSSLLLNPREAGDEAYLLAKRLPKIPVLVGKNRIKSGKAAINKFGVDVLILDDGFQHRRLARDLDIVLIDAANPFGAGRLFPSGILREPLSALSRADVFLLTRTDEAADYKKIRERLLKINPSALIIESVHKPISILDKEGKGHPLTIIKGKKVLALSGIGHPESFEMMLKNLGAKGAVCLRYPDHHSYSQRDIEEIKEKSKEVELIISTEKDKVRLPLSLLPSIFFLRIEFCLVKNDQWQELLV